MHRKLKKRRKETHPPGMRVLAPSLAGFQGMTVAVPLAMSQVLFTHLMVPNAPPLTAEDLGGLAALAHVTYGGDRLADALRPSPHASATKEALYDNIRRTRGAVAWSLVLAFACLQPFFASPALLPFLPALFVSFRYKDWVKPTVAKAAFVGAGWSAASVAMPLCRAGLEPAAALEPSLVCALILFALSNLADVPDVVEDAAVGVPTLPVVLGPSAAASASAAALVLALAVTL